MANLCGDGYGEMTREELIRELRMKQSVINYLNDQIDRPEGFQLVPIKPTMGMYDDFNEAMRTGEVSPMLGRFEAAYAAMLAAARGISPSEGK